ncbi:ABC transporter G family member 11 [Vanrija pseudolonga]|uniref:ABC transporter G family member 11 n=1 Tax=Vanrija pseudolonga TaxID=143232 RepID=A0AAF0YE28_9TREE|nr:ABC transporter G family member 11 [Vanrija pseudolonga]
MSPLQSKSIVEDFKFSHDVDLKLAGHSSARAEIASNTGTIETSDDHSHASPVKAVDIDIRSEFERASMRVVYRHLTYEVKGGKPWWKKVATFDWKKSTTKRILDDVSIRAPAKGMTAILGPSGSGKSTLLEVMSFRRNGYQHGGKCYVNEQEVQPYQMAVLGALVEQDDDHFGVLTVRETIAFAMKLAGRYEVSQLDRIIEEMGLSSCQNVRIGNAIQKGISGGQKRRLTVATALVTSPKILFLDEPTSGLDSFTSKRVIACIRDYAYKHDIAVFASLHQPSVALWEHFEEIAVLDKGRLVFLGTMIDAENFCRDNMLLRKYDNPADKLIEMVSGIIPIVNNKAPAVAMREHYELSLLGKEMETVRYGSATLHTGDLVKRRGISHQFNVIAVLFDRLLTNYSRNLLAFGIRMGMFLGMGAMLALIWINLARVDDRINDRLSIHFFSVAFLSFMSVAGIPSFIEERSVYVRERRNGLYGPLPFLLANTFVLIPFVFGCALIFSIIIYWSIGLHPGAGHFFRFLSFLFLALLVAETQSSLIAAIVPIFVAALALTAFVNGFWMCVQGFFIRGRSLPRFWYYSFHFMDYQTYAFEILAKNDLVGVVFKCRNFFPGSTTDCNCVYPASQETIDMYGKCAVTGQDVIDYLGFGGISVTGYAFILLGIFVLYRFFLYIALRYTGKL